MSEGAGTTELLPPARDGEAEVGERLTVIDLTTSAVHDYRLVATDAVHVSAGELSITTPLGSALLGRHVGDVVATPDYGDARRLEVVEIDG